MADVQITVRGTAESTHAPERATVHLGVSIEGATRDSVFGGVSSSASSIAAQITPLVDEQAGPVTWWTSDQIRTWTHRPWNESGRRTQLTELARAAAVRDAVDKASSYAHSLGLGEVRPSAIADLGMLDDPQPSSYGRSPSRGFALQDITITSSVDARFVA